MEETEGSVAGRISSEAWALVGLVVAAAVLRLAALGYQDIWDDESYSLALAERGFGHMVSLFKLEANGTLYELVLWPLVRISHGAAMLRAPALVAGLAAVPALWWAGRELVGRRAALLGAALLAVNPFAVWYSQEARPYMFAVLFACLSYGCLVRAVAGSDRRWWVGWVAATALLAYSEALGLLLIVPAQAVLVPAGGREALRRAGVSLAWLAVLVVPLVYLLVESSRQRNALYGLGHPRAGALFKVAYGYTFGLQTGSVLGLLAVAVAAAAVLLALYRARDRLPSVRELPRHRLTPVFTWALGPIALLWLVSQVKPAFHHHYLIPVLPGVCLALAVCLLALPRRAAVGLSALVVALALAGTFEQSTTSIKARWGEAAGYLEQARRPGDPLLLDTVALLPTLGYAYPAVRAPDGSLVVKEWRDRPLPRGLTGLDDPDGYADAPPGPPTARLIKRLARGHTLFVVVAGTAVSQGDVPASAGLAWARRACGYRTREFPQIYIARISRCSS